MRGFVSCIKRGAPGMSTYFLSIADGGFRSVAVGESVILSLGEAIEYDGTVARGAEGDHKREVYEALEILVARLMDRQVYRKSVKQIDVVTEALWPKLRSASALFLRKLMLNAPIVVRFHNDADGSSGAYCLYLSMKELLKERAFPPNIFWIMNRGVSYSRSDAENDVLLCNSYETVEKPLLLVLDFGTTTESNAGIEALREKFDIVWLDHHPIMQGFEGKKLDHYINPWTQGGDSNYTAGFLASAFAKTFSGVDTSEFENASFIGDYSEYANPYGAGSDASTIFDLVTSDLRMAFGPGKHNVTPQEFEAIFNDKDRSAELLRYAKLQLNEALDLGVNSMKRYKCNGFDAFLLDFEDVRSEEVKYPLPGRFASKLLTKLNEMGIKRAVLVVNVGAYILMRLDKGMCNKHDLLSLIEEMKNLYPDAIEAGGGHRCAGTIKMRDKSMSKEMTNSVLKIIRSWL